METPHTGQVQGQTGKRRHGWHPELRHRVPRSRGWTFAGRADVEQSFVCPVLTKRSTRLSLIIFNYGQGR